MLAYRVTSSGGCFNITHGCESFRPAIKGTAQVDDPGGRLVHFEYQAKQFPPAFPLAYWKEDAWWGQVAIGDASYLLPVIWRS